MSFNKETGMYEGYIYKIVNGVNGKIYIGQTRRTIEERWKEHLYFAIENNKATYHLYSSFHKYGIDAFNIYQICMVVNQDKEELAKILNKLEIYYISFYNSTNSNNGYNMTIGGNNVSEYIKTKVNQYRFDGTLLQTWDSITEASNKTDTSLNCIVDSCNGRTNFCGNFIWRYINDDFNKYPISKNALTRIMTQYKIKQYDKFGTLINIYEGEELKKLYGKACYSKILSTCRYERKSYDGFIWRHEFYEYNANDFPNIKFTNYNPNKISKNKKGQILPKKVNCYNADNQYIKTYTSIQEAGILNNLKNPYTITLVCQHKRKYAGGYKWFYANDNTQPDKTKIIA